jgi:hypothetical protein
MRATQFNGADRWFGLGVLNRQFNQNARTGVPPAFGPD